MNKNYTDKKIKAVFLLADEYHNECSDLFYKIIWNRADAQVLQIDSQEVLLRKNELLCLTPLQKLSFISPSNGIEIILFNREFYCIEQHDHEVSCYGLLFYGAAQMMRITPNDAEIAQFDLLLKVIHAEFEIQDHLQGEMLRVLLKRWVIKCTQIAKKTYYNPSISDTKIDIIRQFHILVESHYKSKKQVSDYAELLHKSPKTLSNIFSLHHSQSPLQVIHERILVEAKRLLLYTSKNITEIATELGFEEIQQFSKFFKKMASLSPLDFRGKK